jgi:hypothetical protein
MEYLNAKSEVGRWHHKRPVTVTLGGSSVPKLPRAYYCPAAWYACTYNFNNLKQGV